MLVTVFCVFQYCEFEHFHHDFTFAFLLVGRMHQNSDLWFHIVPVRARQRIYIWDNLIRRIFLWEEEHFDIETYSYKHSSQWLCLLSLRAQLVMGNICQSKRHNNTSLQDNPLHYSSSQYEKHFKNVSLWLSTWLVCPSCRPSCRMLHKIDIARTRAQSNFHIDY